MRKNCLLLAVLSLALAFVSCKKDDKPAVTGDMMRFTATIGNGGEKTAIYDGKKVKWTEKDSVLINGKVFHSELEDGGKTAIFTGEALEAAEYEAYYLVDYAKSGDKYVLPAIQKYAAGDILSGVNPMYAYSTTTDLQFYNICAVMKLVVKGKGNVKTITVSANEPLSGAFTVESDATVGFYAKLTSTSKDAATLTLDCGDGVTLSKTTATTFYVALPQGEYTNLKFTLNGGLSWSSEAFSMNLTAGKMRTKELIGVDVVKPVPPYCVSGEFTINGDGDKVYFSNGNLYYDGTDSKWKFEANQWDFRTYAGYGSCINSVYDENSGTPTNDWGLFGWSTDASNNNWGMHTKSSTTSGYTNGNFKDWGGITDLPDNAGGSTWRTLSNAEWDYLLDTRDNASFLRAWVTLSDVNNVPGLVILPDGSTATANTVTTAAALESSGAVFLPASSYRNGTDVRYVGSYGNYWSSTPSGTDYAYLMSFLSGDAYTLSNSRYRGYSVRLVQSVSAVEN